MTGTEIIYGIVMVVMLIAAAVELFAYGNIDRSLLFCIMVMVTRLCAEREKR